MLNQLQEFWLGCLNLMAASNNITPRSDLKLQWETEK